MISQFLHKRYFLFCIVFLCAFTHPIYVSVTEIEHNAKDKTIEISCKVYTDDFEKALRSYYKTKIDVTTPANKEVMNTLVSNYIKKHLSILVNDKKAEINFIGYEKIEEGIYCYFEAKGISTVKKITITDNVMYEYKKEQVSVLHVTANNVRKSTKLNNPEDIVTFSW